jgi:zinc transport system permease protein
MLIFLPGLIGAFILSITHGLLGCFLQWKRLSYLSDVLSHASLLGLALGLFFQMGLPISMGIMAVFLFFFLTNDSRFLPMDTRLAIISYTSLALGFLIINYAKNQNGISMESYLWGDILLLEWDDLKGLIFCLLATLVGFTYLWRPMLLLCLDEEFAQASYHEKKRYFQFIRFYFSALITLVIAFTLSTVGALLIPALFIIPPACASYWSRNPKSMAIISILFSMISMVIGIYIAWTFNCPTGPSIVLTSSCLLIMSFTIKKIKLSFY